MSQKGWRSLIHSPWPASLAASVLLLAAAGQAAVPNRLNYQGKLANDQGVAVPDGQYAMVFSLYDQLTGGSALWSESQTVSVRDGIFSVELGSTVALPDFFQQYYLETKVAADPPLPRHQLVGAPYALVAARPAPGSVDSVSIANGSIAAADIAAGTITSAGNEVGPGSLAPDDRTASLVAAVACPVSVDRSTSKAAVFLCRATPVAQPSAQALVIVRLDQQAGCSDSGSSTRSHRLETTVELRRQGVALATGTLGASVGNQGVVANDSLALVQMVRLDNNNPLEVWASWRNISNACSSSSSRMTWSNIHLWIADLGYDTP